MSKQDILIRSNQFGLYDLQLTADGSDFASAEGFESAIPVSLFTDARAPSSLVAEPRNRRGWLGNLLTIDQNRELGGLLWVYDQGRLTVDLLNNVKFAAERSLQWMIDDGIVRNVAVNTTVNGDRSIRVLITLTALDNSVDQYSVLWRRTQVSQLKPV